MLSSEGKYLWNRFVGEFPLLLEIDSDHNVYASGKSRELFSFDAQGNLRWRQRIPDHVVTAGDMSDDGKTIVLGTVGAWIYVFDDYGELLWQKRLPEGSVTTGHNAIDMTPDGQWIVAGGSEGTVALYNRKGTLMWSDTSKDRRDPSQYTHSETGAMTVAISDDGRYIAAGYGDSTIRIFERETVETPSEGFSKEVTYRSGELTLMGYLCKPQGFGPFPAVVYNHGGLGGLMGGAPKETCEALAKEGLVGFSPIRRQATSLDGNLNDVMAAVDYVRKLSYVDMNQLGMIGFSRGALLTFITAIERPDIKAIILMAPGEGIMDSNLIEVDGPSAPVLILVSENDNIQLGQDHVLVSKMLEERLFSAGKQVDLIIYPPFGQDGHELFFEVREEYWTDVLTFFHKHLNKTGSVEWIFTFSQKQLLFEGGYADPSVIRMPDGTFLMFLNKFGDEGSGTLILSSNDGVSWEEETDIVFQGVAVGRAVKFPEGIRFYYHQPPRAKENRGTIVSSFSSNGITSWEYEGVRIRPREGYRVAGPTVIMLENGSYRMFFHEIPNNTTQVLQAEIFGATSRDGLSWTRDDAPTIVYEESVEGIDIDRDVPQILHPFVMRWPDGGYLMFYNSHNRIFAAYSQDGFSWEKIGSIGIRGADFNAILLPDRSMRIFFGNPDRPGGVLTGILRVEFSEPVDRATTVTRTTTLISTTTVASTTTLRTTETSTFTIISTTTVTTSTVVSTQPPLTITVTSEVTETVGLPPEFAYVLVAIAVIVAVLVTLTAMRRTS